MSEAILKQFLKPIPCENNEGIYRVVEELSQKAGIEAPALYTSNGHHFMLNTMPAAAITAGGKPVIMLNHNMLNDMLGGGIKFAEHTSIPDELKAIVAHELGHIKRGDTKLFGTARIAQITPLACMAGTLVGLHLIRSHWYKNGGADNGKPLSPGEAEKELQLPEEVKSSTLETAQKMALYTVAAAAGLTAGIVASRALRHRMEYACDAFSKELMGSEKPIASALQKMGVYIENYERKVLETLPENTRGTMRKFIKVIEGLFHPSIANRVERLAR